MATTKQLKEKFILLKTAAAKYGTKERNILNWAKSGKVTACHIGDTWAVDDYSIKRFLELNKKISDYDKHLEKIVEERENLIFQKENELFLLRTFQGLTPAGRLVLAEMALLVTDKTKRNVFFEISSGHDINLVARQYNLTVENIRYYYTFAGKVISKKLGFLKDYRETMAQLKFQVRELEINNQHKENEINRLLSLVPSLQRTEPEAITPEIVKLLSTPLCTLPFETRALNCFHWYGVSTVEDLLRLTKNIGLKILMDYRSFGKKSLGLLKVVLIENNIIDANEDSHLYKFL